MGKIRKREEKGHTSNQKQKHKGIQKQKPVVNRRQHSQNVAQHVKTKLAHLHEGRPKDVKPVRQQSTQREKLRFNRWDRVLLVGEGDFSFALSVKENHEVGSIVATSYDDEKGLEEKYPRIQKTISKLSASVMSNSNSNGDALQKAAHDKSSRSDMAKTDTDDDMEGEEWQGFSSSPLPPSSKTTDIPESQGSTNSKVLVFHGIDATKLSTTHRKLLRPHAPFTKIVFNFPHTGGLSTDVNRQVRANQELLINFFDAAKPQLATQQAPAKSVVFRSADGDGGQDVYDDDEEYDDEEYDDEEYDDEGNPVVGISESTRSQGTILVTLFEGEPYTLWNIRDLARHCGLQVVESFKFPWSEFPGYIHARTVGEIKTGKDRSAEGKRKGAWRGEERDARCYVFALKGVDVSNSIHGRPAGVRKRDVDEDDSE